jgi:pimeloyl-ACP methyl ester carboxylesterase
LPAALRAPGLANDLRNLAALAAPPFDRITCPVILTHSRADIVVPIAHSRLAARQMSHARFVTTWGHHYVFYVPTTQHRQGMHDFLKRCARPNS